MDSVNHQRSRSTAAEDEGSDHIGVDSPRSGVATPQPDPHDRRLPGIMSYFNQVRASSLQRWFSRPFRMIGKSATTPKPNSPDPGPKLQAATPAQELAPSSPIEEEEEEWMGVLDDGPPLLPHEMLGPARAEPEPAKDRHQHQYTTPPNSQPPSMRDAARGSSDLAATAGTPPASRKASQRNLSISSLGKGGVRRSSLLAPLTTAVSDTNASALHISNPAGRSAKTVPNSPTRGYFLCVYLLGSPEAEADKHKERLIYPDSRPLIDPSNRRWPR
jgi:hypothetical protein